LQTALEAAGNPVALQHSATANGQRVRLLEAEVRTLRDAVAEHKKQLEAQAARHDDTVRDLRKKLLYAQQQSHRHNGEGGGLQSLLHELAGGGDGHPRSASIGRSGLNSSEPGVIGSSGGAGKGGGASELPKGKLRAFEMTVAALNAELAQLEDKIVGMEARHTEERAALERRCAAERERFEAEQVECDNVLATISTELEQSMKENVELRTRLQSQYHAHHKSR
jgi:predicted  nucleic acid-binding Zn-ribbon protein